MNITTSEKLTLDENSMRLQVQIAVGVFIGLAILHALFKTWKYYIRHAATNTTLRIFFSFIIYSIETIGNYLLLISSIICIYIVVIYKSQTVLHISLPDESTERTITILIYIAFGAKIIEIITLMHHHRDVNIFFIDWEQPRRTSNQNTDCNSPHTNFKISHVQKYYQDIHSSRTRRRSSGDHSKDNSTQHHSISTWRTCFIANQWLRMKTKRRTYVTFQIMISLCMLEILGLKFWTLAIPEWTFTLKSNSLISKNCLFALGIATGIFIFVYSLQWIAFSIYETYVKNCLQEFIDLCSVANISIFILSHDYLGYYIHGRSVHGFADKDLPSLINDLEYEENNQCAHRGLIPGTCDQTFIVTVSKKFRSYYDAIIMSINDNLNRTIRRYSSHEKQSTSDRRLMRLKLHEFFCSHLDHSLKHVDYIVREKGFLEKLCDIELANAQDASIFYIDKNYSFNKTIFYGNEWTLATFELVTFLFVLVMGGNWITCAGVTLLISKVIAWVAQIDQRKQLAAKTLIDKRFLI